MSIENEMSKEQYLKAIKKLEREKWEKTFAYQLDVMNWYYERQYRFHPTREWAFDFVVCPYQREVAEIIDDPVQVLKLKILVDIQGGIWSGGAHVGGLGYKNDIEKMNAATALSWDVYWFTSDMVKDGSAIKFLKEEVWGL